MTLTDVQVHFKSGKGDSLALELPYPAEKKAACLHLTQLPLHCTMLSTIGVPTAHKASTSGRKPSSKSYLFATWIFLAPTHQRLVEEKKESMHVANVLLEKLSQGTEHGKGALKFQGLIEEPKTNCSTNKTVPLQQRL